MPPKKKIPPKKKTTAAVLVVGPLQTLSRNEGSRVKIALKPSKKANFTAYQNITVKIGGDAYTYCEAWSLNSQKAQFDTFSVPPDLRDKLYHSDAKMWLEPGGVDATYKVGRKHDAATPWGATKGAMTQRTIPATAAVTRRKTTLRWTPDGTLMPPTEKRS